jgi:mono/diheme cytochrome c family protein
VSGLRRLKWLLVAALAVVLAGCGDADPNPLAEGIRVYGRVCAACHGDTGQGGIGPALAEVVTDFPSCDDHIEWVTGGSDGWKADRGDTFGATDKPVEGGMPAFGASLSAEEIASVAAYERHRHGGQDLETVLEECGVGEVNPPALQPQR